MLAHAAQQVRVKVCSAPSFFFDIFPPFVVGHE